MTLQILHSSPDPITHFSFDKNEFDNIHKSSQNSLEKIEEYISVLQEISQTMPTLQIKRNNEHTIISFQPENGRQISVQIANNEDDEDILERIEEKIYELTTKIIPEIDNKKAAPKSLDSDGEKEIIITAEPEAIESKEMKKIEEDILEILTGYDSSFSKVVSYIQEKLGTSETTIYLDSPRITLYLEPEKITVKDEEGEYVYSNDNIDQTLTTLSNIISVLILQYPIEAEKKHIQKMAINAVSSSDAEILINEIRNKNWKYFAQEKEQIILSKKEYKMNISAYANQRKIEVREWNTYGISILNALSYPQVKERSYGNTLRLKHPRNQDMYIEIHLFDFLDREANISDIVFSDSSRALPYHSPLSPSGAVKAVEPPIKSKDIQEVKSEETEAETPIVMTPLPKKQEKNEKKESSTGMFQKMINFFFQVKTG